MKAVVMNKENRVRVLLSALATALLVVLGSALAPSAMAQATMSVTAYGPGFWEDDYPSGLLSSYGGSVAVNSTNVKINGTVSSNVHQPKACVYLSVETTTATYNHNVSCVSYGAWRTFATKTYPFEGQVTDVAVTVCAWTLINPWPPNDIGDPKEWGCGASEWVL